MGNAWPCPEGDAGRVGDGPPVVVCLARVAVAAEAGPNRLPARLRTFGDEPREAGRDGGVELPAEACRAYAF